MRTSLVRGAMICAEASAQAVSDGRLPGGPGIRVDTAGSPGYGPPLEILAGIFARKGERGHYHPEHPLNLLWSAFRQHADDDPASDS